MAPVGQVLGVGLFTKTKLCRFHSMGKCAKGTQCPWAHDEFELQAAPDLRCTKLCRELMNRGRCTRANCNFAHSKAECRAVRASDGTVRSLLTEPSVLNPGRVVEMSTSTAFKAGQASSMDVAEYVPVCLSADAPEFIPGSFTSEVPAFVPMPSGGGPLNVDIDASMFILAGAAPALVPMLSPPPGLPPPPGLEDYVSYGRSQEESESDCSSHEDIKTEDAKLDGNTPIAQILAMCSRPGETSPSVSTVASMVDLQLALEEQRMFITDAA